jgi:hypothetical protein
MLEPESYPTTIAALKIFYEFLGEKKYIKKAKPFIEKLDEIEDDFILFLKSKY